MHLNAVCMYVRPQSDSLLCVILLSYAVSTRVFHIAIITFEISVGIRCASAPAREKDAEGRYISVYVK